MGSLVLLDLMGGVALLLWGLHMVHSGILRAFGPDLRLLLAKALNNRFTAFAAGLGLTALLQSSTATALITSSFTSEGLVALVPALAIMLGANVGSAINPILEGARRDNPASYRLPLGNLVNRLVGVLLVAPFLHPIAGVLQSWQPDLAKATAAFHITFNVATAILFIGLLDGMARLLKTMLPKRVQEADPSRPRYLDESALETPSLALADAARETLHMGDHVEIMLRKVMAAMMTNDRALVDQVSRMDNSVDGLDEAIKLYVTKLPRGSLDEREGQRAMEIVSFAINLEHIGDIIDKNLSELATKKIKRRFQFSAEGAEELSAFHKRTMDSLRIAFGVFMSGDVNEARKLLAEKALLRNAELAATERHLDRLREGRPESIETTSLHLDVLRDLRRIHSHICSVAYPVLDAAGELAAYRSTEHELAAIPNGVAASTPR